MAEPGAVLFDLDETLLDDDASMHRALRMVCSGLGADHGLPPEALARAYLDVAERTWPELGDVPTAGRPDLADGWAIRVWMWREALGAVDAAPDLADEAAGRYRSARRRTYRAFEDALPTLRGLAREYRLGVVTNGAPDTQREKLEALGLGEYLGTVVISGEAGVGKPDPEIFRIALGELDAPPHRAVHVGDSLENDVRGAASAGIRAVWLNRAGRRPPTGSARPAATIRTLAGLPALLARLSQGASPPP